MKKKPIYQRILLKISGEVFSELSHEKNPYDLIAQEIIEIQKRDVQVGIVLGGGNILRGIRADILGLRRNVADQMGMLATIINCLHLKEILEKHKTKAVVYSTIPCGTIALEYRFENAMSSMERGDIVLFGGGTGNPYFSTDTAAAILSIETQCEILLKATKVDGIYDKDPMQYPDASRLDEISYTEFLKKQLQIMDLSAVELCRSHGMEISVFNMFEPEALKKILNHEKVGTRVFGE